MLTFKNLILKYLSRKFILTLGILFFSCFALWFGKFSENTVKELFFITLLIYSGTNVLSKFSSIAEVIKLFVTAKMSSILKTDKTD